MLTPRGEASNVRRCLRSVVHCHGPGEHLIGTIEENGGLAECRFARRRWNELALDDGSNRPDLNGAGKLTNECDNLNTAEKIIPRGRTFETFTVSLDPRDHHVDCRYRYHVPKSLNSLFDHEYFWKL